MCPTRLLETVANRLPLEHTMLTHRFKYFRQPPPTCNNCHTILTVDHILHKCIRYNHHPIQLFKIDHILHLDTEKQTSTTSNGAQAYLVVWHPTLWKLGGLQYRNYTEGAKQYPEKNDQRPMIFSSNELWKTASQAYQYRGTTTTRGIRNWKIEVTAFTEL